MRVTLHNREIHNPIAKGILYVLYVTLAAMTAPIWLPLDIALKLLRRKGFIHIEHDSIHLLITKEGFHAR